MGRLVYFDCASGASGDMLLGALLDLGLPLEALRAELARLPLSGYRLEARRVRRSGLDAAKLDVLVEGSSHPHRHLAEIRKLIEGAGLAAGVSARCVELFERLAEAEAAVHGTSPEKVHFHEVGAVDSIVDVVGGVWGLAELGADRFWSSPLNLGSGSVTMSHGTFPVPPPATARLVEGVPVYGAGDGELLTPTGALLVTGHATGYGPLPAIRIEKSGWGAGSRDVAGRPNALRLILGEEADAGSDADQVVVLECQVDDMSPELLAPLSDALIASGALDAYLTPVQMKKGRPGFLITVLAVPERREALEERLFAETTTLGVRRQLQPRSMLARGHETVETPYGPVRIKLGRRGERIYNAQPEFEDCRRAAEQRGVPLKEVWAAALAAHHRGGSR